MYPYGSFLGINDYFYEHEESSFCVAAGWSYQQSKQYDGMSELALANVEALARWEDPNEGTGKKKDACYDRGILTGTKCSPSSSRDDKCHYIYDQKGTCN